MKKAKYIGSLGYCRKCLNKRYGLKLKQKDVMIYLYPGECARCRQVKNIVYSVKPLKRWKLIRMKK